MGSFRVGGRRGCVACVTSRCHTRDAALVASSPGRAYCDRLEVFSFGDLASWSMFVAGLSIVMFGLPGVHDVEMRVVSHT